ncbi:MAG: RnfABCDGE type electron transport complex subunit D [Candidatus Omnitrophica bacterium]|nr:RnfABCDGE type electron transport complex subunit D [Candidatus Omnitrophota bacterium]
MAETTPSYKTTLPPHIHSVDSLARRNWGQLLALAPLFMTACFTGHAEILRVLLICLVSAIAFEFLAAKLFRKKENLQNGEAALAASLFALLMPSRCPSEVVILGVFMAVFAAKELFGGTGSYLLQPVLLARAFLQLCFPKVLSEPMLLAGDGSVWVLVAIGFGGILFLKQKQGYWKTPVLFMAVCFICEALLGGQEMPLTFFSAVLFAAFFLLADPVALPLTRKGTVLFVLGAALLSSRLNPEGFSIRSTCYAILSMNLLTPWIDVWLKPISCKTKHPIKATYLT